MPRRRVPRPAEMNRSPLEPRAAPVWGPRSAEPDLMPGDELINTNQAAAILGVKRDAVTRLALRGVIPCWQKSPGKKGSPLQLSLHYVERLMQRPDYLLKRERVDKGRQAEPREFTTGWEEYDIEPSPIRGHTEVSARDRGLFCTVRQAADILGLGLRGVRRLIANGRLRAERRIQQRRRNAVGKLEFGVGNRWWFIRKKDLDALTADPAYIKNHRNYKKSVSPEAREARQQAEEDKVMEEFVRMRRGIRPGRPPRGTYDPCFIWGIGPDWELPRVGKDPHTPPIYWMTADDMREEMVRGPSALEDLLWEERGCI